LRPLRQVFFLAIHAELRQRQNAKILLQTVKKYLAPKHSLESFFLSGFFNREFQNSKEASR